MKAAHNGKTIYIKHVSEDIDYVLVTEDKNLKSKIFKLDVSNIENLKIKDLQKLITKRGL